MRSLVWRNIIAIPELVRMYSSNYNVSAGRETTQSPEYIPFDLCTATCIGDADLLRQMLSKPPVRGKLNTPNRSGWTPAMYASYYGHDKILDFLIQSGAQVSCVNSCKQTALVLSVKCGNLRCCGILLKNGIEVDAKDSEGLTALAYAASLGYDEVTKFLLEHNANVNTRLGKYKMTPLMVASSAGHEKVVKIILDAGANPDSQSFEGKTAIQYAFEKGHSKVLGLFESYRMPIFRPTQFPKPKENLSLCVVPQTLAQSPSQLDNQYPEDLASLLTSLGLPDYISLFEKKNLTLRDFMQLTSDNLKELGVDKLGPRSKMMKAISRLHNMTLQYGSPNNATPSSTQSSEIDLLKKKLVQCETQLYQEKQKSTDSSDSRQLRFLRESVQPMFSLEWRSEKLAEAVKGLETLLWTEQHRIEPILLSQLYDRVQNIDKLSNDMHNDLKRCLGVLKTFQNTNEGGV